MVPARLPVPEDPSPGRTCRKHRDPAEGEEPRGSKVRGAPGPRRRHRALSYTPEPADGGNCDYTQTRTHARTLDATSLGACASTPKPRPAGIRSAPRHALPLSRAARPLPRRPGSTHAHSPLYRLWTSHHFPSSSTWLSMRNWYPSNTAAFSRPSLTLAGGKVGVHAPLGIYLQCQGNTRTSRLQASF